MEQQPSHILTKEGILASFSVSKKITEKEINAMMTGAQNKSKDEDEILELLKAKIMKEIIDATQKGTLPGIILENVENQLLPIKSIESLNRMVQVISQKMKQKKFDKLSLCYFINYLVGSLGLVEEDFEEFHRRIQDARGDDDDDDDDDK
jgi:hypothetical protein